MRILGFRIGWFSSGSRRRRKVTPKLERIASAELLKAALGNPETLVAVLDKFGQIQEYQDDEVKTEIQNLRTKICAEATETLLSNRRRELASRIDGIIDRLMDTGDRSRQQHEEAPFAGTITGRPNGVSVSGRRRPGERGSMRTSSPSALLRDLQALTLLVKLATQGIQTEGGGGTGKMYAVESNGQWLEMDENEYRIYRRRRGRQERKEGLGYPLDINRQPRFPSTTNLVPPPSEEYEG